MSNSTPKAAIVPTPVAERVRRWLNRNVATIVAAAIGGIAIVVAAWIGADAQRDRRAFDRAEQQMQAQLDEKNNVIAKLQQQITLLRRTQSGTSTQNPIDTSDPLPDSADVVATVTETAVPEATATAPYPSNSQSVTDVVVRDLLFRLSRCRMTTGSLRCELTITNQGTAERPLRFSVSDNAPFDGVWGGAYYFDDKGNEYIASGAGVGNHSCNSCSEIKKVLVPNVSVPAWVRIDKVDSSADTVKLLRLKWWDENGSGFADLRNITIVKN